MKRVITSFLLAVLLLSLGNIGLVKAEASTIYLSDSGWSDPTVGTWDPLTKTGTLTQDVTETIQIDSNNITLDGNGHYVTGTGTGTGVYLDRRTGVTVKNLNVSQFSFGILLYHSDGNTITGNTVSNSNDGIALYSSAGNTLTGNNASNGSTGIFLSYSNGNTLTGNIANSNSSYGIDLSYSSGNILTGNIANSSHCYAIFLGGSKDNILTGNTVSNNSYGITLASSNSNTLTGNTFSGNGRGIELNSSSSNIVCNNNFINNATQAYVYGSGGGNIFNLAKPTGGNYWSNWTAPDNDNDGFVDNPYVFTGGQDNLPWTQQNGWLDNPNIPPITTIILSGTLGNNGWYKSDVQVTLTAIGNPGGSSVAQTEYSFDGTSWNTYSAPFMIIAEGTTTIYYRSTDNAGNVEETKTQTINIDKTKPNVTINSPQARDYFTLESLILDFSASDALSGISGLTAILDGNPVTNGQVINLANMAGSHFVTVWAYDIAGNAKAADVIFNVVPPIAATVDIKPDTLNLKSQGNDITAYIELPSGYDVGLIDVTTVQLNVAGTVIAAQLSPTSVGDYDNDGVADLMVKFDRQAVINALNGETGDITMTIVGQSSDGYMFSGSDTIEVINQ